MTYASARFAERSWRGAMEVEINVAVASLFFVIGFLLGVALPWILAKLGGE